MNSRPLQGWLLVVSDAGAKVSDVLAAHGMEKTGEGVFVEVVKKESLPGKRIALLSVDPHGNKSIQEVPAEELAAAYGFTSHVEPVEGVTLFRISTSWNRKLRAGSHVFATYAQYTGTPAASATCMAVGASDAPGADGPSEGPLVDWSVTHSLDALMDDPDKPMMRCLPDHLHMVDDEVDAQGAQFHFEAGRLLERLAQCFARDHEGWVQEVETRTIMQWGDEQDGQVEVWRREDNTDTRRLEIWRYGEFVINGETYCQAHAVMEGAGTALFVTGEGHPIVMTPAWRFLNSDGSSANLISASVFESAAEAANAVVAAAASHLYQQEH